MIGALIGAFGGYRVRMYGAKLAGRDWPVALLGSATALGLAVVIAVKLHSYAAVMGLTTRGRWML